MGTDMVHRALILTTTGKCHVCGRLMDAQEWRAGWRTCEHCPPCPCDKEDV